MPLYLELLDFIRARYMSCAEMCSDRWQYMKYVTSHTDIFTDNSIAKVGVLQTQDV